MSARRLVITGAGGFVGRHVVAEALAVGFEVHALARRGAPEGMPAGAAWHAADLLADPARTDALIAELRPTHLLHAAWQTAHGVYWHSDENPLWVQSTARLAKAFIASGGRRFVLVGSCAEYAWSQDICDEARTPALPATPYGVCKLAAHRNLQALSEMQDGFTAATGRIFFAYGPHEDPARIVPYICRSLAVGEPALLSSGTQVRDFLHVQDVAQGFLALLDSEVQGAVNIASGQPVRLADIARMLGEASGLETLVRLGARPDRADDDTVLVADIGRLLALGWRPGRSLGQGLRETYAWWAATVAKDRAVRVTD